MTMRFLGIAAALLAAPVLSMACPMLAADPASASPHRRMAPHVRETYAPPTRRQRLDRRLRQERQDDRCRVTPRAC